MSTVIGTPAVVVAGWWPSATYQSLGAVLTAHQGAHGPALAGFDLVIVDEAHRTTGSTGKEWAAVHDDTRLSATRRLYLTATPRVREPPGNSAYSEATAPHVVYQHGAALLDLKTGDLVFLNPGRRGPRHRRRRSGGRCILP
ncbi:DEAD/DEAH box helicase family protein [Embleya sp. NPDC050154]|uniref:DEAD/DEAH box helicase family protein n=1 Tax=unclassified Embleya TaxID=2699296 RepID=UPI0037AD331C